MKNYTVNFKKKVVEKVLTEGVVLKEVAKKLNITITTINGWCKKYRDQVTPGTIDLDAIIEECKEPDVDIDKLLNESDSTTTIQTNIADTSQKYSIDTFLEKDKNPEEYSIEEKYFLVETIRNIPEQERGMWLRNHGFYSQHVTLWEKELFIMAKKKISESEKIKQLELENKKLKKALKESERTEKELKILIELKKKYGELFEESKED